MGSFVADWNADTEALAERCAVISDLIDKAIEGWREQPDSGTAVAGPLYAAQQMLANTAEDLRRSKGALEDRLAEIAQDVQHFGNHLSSGDEAGAVREYQLILHDLQDSPLPSGYAEEESF